MLFSQYGDAGNLINLPEQDSSLAFTLFSLVLRKRTGIIANSCNLNPSDLSTKETQHYALNGFSSFVRFKSELGLGTKLPMSKRRRVAVTCKYSAIEFYPLQVLEVESFRTVMHFHAVITIFLDENKQAGCFQSTEIAVQDYQKRQWLHKEKINLFLSFSAYKSPHAGL